MQLNESIKDQPLDELANILKNETAVEVAVDSVSKDNS